MRDIKELSALDIHYLLKGFKVLDDSKVENIYQRDNSLSIILYVKEMGKRVLRILLPSIIYLSDKKEEMPKTPPQFCVIARKYLKGAKLTTFRQIGFERIIEIGFQSKGQKYFLVVELFSKGNLIICNSSMKIIYPMTHQEWKDRVIKGGRQRKDSD